MILLLKVRVALYLLSFYIDKTFQQNFVNGKITSPPLTRTDHFVKFLHSDQKLLDLAEVSVIKTLLLATRRRSLVDLFHVRLTALLKIKENLCQWSIKTRQYYTLIVQIQLNHLQAKKVRYITKILAYNRVHEEYFTQPIQYISYRQRGKDDNKKQRVNEQRGSAYYYFCDMFPRYC